MFKSLFSLNIHNNLYLLSYIILHGILFAAYKKENKPRTKG